MKRKLVQMGQHCLMSAIPKKWLKHHGLNKGDHINFEEVEQYLLLSPTPLPKDKSISISFKKANRLGVVRALQLLYDSGFKTVRVSFDEEQTLTWILWAVQLLEQWRVGPVKKGKCTINSVDIEEEFQTYFRRIMLLTKELSHTYLKYLQGDKTRIDEIRSKYLIILSGTYSLRRMINTSSLPLEYKYYYFITIQLEEIADHYEYLLRYLEKMRTTPKMLIPLQRKLCGLFDGVYTNFYKFDLDWLTELTSSRIWRWFETEKNSLLVYHQRAISERMKNIAKYTVGIRMK